MNNAIQNEIRSVNISQALEDPQNKSIIAVLTRFSELLAKCGYEVRVYSESALIKLQEVPFEKKQTIISHYEKLCSWLQGELEKPLSTDDLELRCLKRALDHYGIAPHDDFWKTVEQNQIIELYGDDMVQLYRSLNFYEITGYSLLDVSVYEWYVLWSRPKQALEMMTTYIQETLSSFTSVERVKIPQHVIREIHNSSLAETFIPRASLAEFLNIGTLRPNRPNALIQNGFIISSRGEVIAVGDDANTIQFI